MGTHPDGEPAVNAGDAVAGTADSVSRDGALEETDGATRRFKASPYRRCVG